MKTLRLILMRHGEAEDGRDDHARRLTKRGHDEARRTCEALGGFVDFLPTLMLVSDAARTRETASALAEAMVHEGVEVKTSNVFYLASPRAMAAQLEADAAGEGRAHGTVLVVAHNPGLSEWGTALTRTYVGLGTAEAVLLVAEAESWAVALQGPSFRLVAKLPRY